MMDAESSRAISSGQSAVFTPDAYAGYGPTQASGPNSTRLAGPLSGPSKSKSFVWYRRLLGFLLIGGLLAATLGAVETLAQRRRRVEKMSAEQREELFHNEQLFGELLPQDRQRIRDLHDQIESAPDREKLRATMNRYYKWFEMQPPFRRARLRDKKQTLKDRITMVRGFLLQKKQAPTKDIHLDNRSRRVLASWLERFTAENGARFIESMAKAHPWIATLPLERQKEVVRDRLLRLWQTGDPKGELAITPYEKEHLRAQLSPELRAKLRGKEPAEQDRIVADLLRETASHEIDEELANFFDSSMISDEDRDRLMSQDDMYKSLSDLYSAHLKQTQSTEPPQGDRPRGHHPGSPKGSGGRRWSESRDEKDFRASKDPKDNQKMAGPPHPAEKRGPEKTHPEKPSAEKAAQEPFGKKPGGETRKNE